MKLSTLAVASALCLASTCGWAQNLMCPTRPFGDSTNACASTAFTTSGIAANFASPPPLGNIVPNAVFATTLSASGIVSGQGFINRFSSPGPIGNVTPSTIAATTINALTLNATTLKCEAAATHGFVGDGVVDNTSVFNTWKTGLGTASGCLQFPAGVFRFNSAITISLAINQYLDLRGANTELRFIGAHDGLSITYAAATVPPTQPTAPTVNINGFKITTDQAVAQRGLHIKGTFAGIQVPATYVSDLNVTGTADGKGWAIGVDLEELATAYISKTLVLSGCFSITCTDIGIHVHGSGTTPRSVDVHLVNVDLQRGGFGVKADGHFEGITVEDSHLIGMNFGVSCNSTVAFPQCDVRATHISARVTDIEIEDISQSNISNNLLYASAHTGMPANSPIVTIVNGEDSAIVGNVFVNAGLSGTPNGISLTNADRTVITGNNLNGMGVALTMNATTSNVSGEGNYLGAATVSDSGTLNNLGYAKSDGIVRLDSSTHSIFTLDKGAGDLSSVIRGARAGLNRWEINLGNNGAADLSDFTVCRYNTAGAGLDCPFSINRSNGAILAFFPIQSITYIYATPLTGTTVTILDTQDRAIIDPAGTLAALTVTLPSCTAGFDGKSATFSTTQTITSLTVNATSGTVKNAPTTAGVAQGFNWVCRGANTSWFRNQ